MISKQHLALDGPAERGLAAQEFKEEEPCALKFTVFFFSSFLQIERFSNVKTSLVHVKSPSNVVVDCEKFTTDPDRTTIHDDIEDVARN